MRFDLANPTPRQVDNGFVSGIIAASIAVPVLVTAIFLGSQTVRWGYIYGALACVAASAVYLAFFVVITKGKADIRARANVGVATVCLALASLGFLTLGAASPRSTFTPVVLVAVAFVSIIGDSKTRIGIAAYAIVLVALISWGQAYRGTGLAAVLVVSASSIIVIMWITSRAVGSLYGSVNVKMAFDTLNQRLEEAPPAEGRSSTAAITRIMELALPLVTEILPASAVAIFVRERATLQLTPMTSWHADPETIRELSEQAELAQAVRADAPVLTDEFCAIPVGFCPEGELVMAVRRLPLSRGPDRGIDGSADQLAAAFLRLTSRANFVSGLHVESRTDPLTGLANRSNLFERIEMEMAHALRSETPLSVAMIDLDHFKAYNDAYGHVAGDTLLRSISAIMVSNIRGQDMVARYGGEEFCLVMPDTDLVGGHNLLETLRAGGRDATSEMAVTLSAGLTSWDGTEDTRSFIERADQALSRAKETGRNRVVSIQSFTEF